MGRGRCVTTVVGFFHPSYRKAYVGVEPTFQQVAQVARQVGRAAHGRQGVGMEHRPAHLARKLVQLWAKPAPG